MNTQYTLIEVYSMIKEEIGRKFLDIIKDKGYHVREYVDLKDYTSLKIGGPARFLCEPFSVDEIKDLIIVARKLQIPFFVLGNGSNVLVSDEGFNGLIIVTKTNMNHIEVVGTTIKASAGAMLKDVCMFAYDNALTGLEFAYGIPASVGGAVFMNAGAYGGEIKDVLLKCTYLNEKGEIHTISKEELDFSYRHSYFSDKKDIILEAEFALNIGNKENIKEVMDDLLNRRKSKQPLDYPSAGSTFKRPKGNYASALIEHSGLKGFQHKNAMVSDKHAGFVINYNNATSAAFIELIDIVKDVVKDKTGYELECEVRMIGENNNSHDD